MGCLKDFCEINEDLGESCMSMSVWRRVVRR